VAKACAAVVARMVAQAEKATEPRLEPMATAAETVVARATAVVAPGFAPLVGSTAASVVGMAMAAASRGAYSSPLRKGIVCRHSIRATSFH